MISKALRPADPRSKLLKRVSHHFLSDAPDVSAGEPDPLHPEETDKEVTEETLATDKTASRDNTTSGSGSKSSPTGPATEPGTPPGLPSSAEPRAEFPGTTGSTAVTSTRSPAGTEPVEAPEPTRTDKNAKSEKAGKEKKSRRHDKEGKAGKGRKSSKHGKKASAAAAKPVKPRETGKKTATEEPVATASAPIAAAQAEPGNAQPARLAPVPVPVSKPTLAEVDAADATPLPDTLPAAQSTPQQAEQKTGRETEVVPCAQDLNLATAGSRRHMPVHLILVFGLITLFGLWGYRYWHTEHDSMKPTATRAVMVKRDRQESQPVVAVAKDTQATPSVAAAPPVTQAAPPAPVTTTENTPEPATTIEPDSKPVAPRPPPRYRPPAYRPYPPPAAWPQPRFYGNYPPPLFRQAPPPRSYRGQATAPEETE